MGLSKPSAGRLVACVLLGLASTLALPWVHGLWFPVVTGVVPPFGSDVRYFDSEAHRRLWVFTMERRAGYVEIVSYAFTTGAVLGTVIDPDRMMSVDEIPRWSAMRDVPARAFLLQMTVQDLAYGWPLPALAERRAYPSRKTFGALAIPQWMQWIVPGPSVPVHPVLSGVIVDTLVHAPIWIVLLFVGGNVRRWRRRLVGLCPVCGYDLRATEADRCPECGMSNPGQHD